MRVINTFLPLLMSLSACETGVKETQSPVFPPGSKYQFVVIGDSRDGLSIYAQLLREIVSEEVPEFTVHLGDMISSPGNGDEFPIFSKVTDSYIPLKQFFPIIGNHDVSDEDSLDVLRTVFPVVPREGYYLQNLKDCFCLFLSTEGSSSGYGIGEEQLKWLQSHLSSDASRQAKFRVVFLHRPPFPFGHHIDTPLPGANLLHELFVESRVDLVFSGHEHLYGRKEKEGVQYIVSGGGGSPLWQGEGKDAIFHYIRIFVFDKQMLVQAVSLTGRIHDEFSIDF